MSLGFYHGIGLTGARCGVVTWCMWRDVCVPTVEGAVVTWGYGGYGQLGQGGTDGIPRRVPRRVDVLAGETVRCVTAGGGHSAAVVGA